MEPGGIADREGGSIMRPCLSAVKPLSASGSGVRRGHRIAKGLAYLSCVAERTSRDSSRFLPAFFGGAVWGMCSNYRGVILRGLG